MRIGAKIKKLRELKDIPQKCIAEELNLSIAGYGKIERDEVEITFSKLEAIGTILELEPCFIVDFDVETFLNANRERKNLKGLIKELKNQNSFLFEQNDKLISAMSYNKKFLITKEELN